MSLSSATYRRIGVPLDGTPEAEQALRLAIAIAQRARCPLELVHVLVPPPVTEELYGISALPVGEMETMRLAATQRLSYLTAELERRGVRSNASVVAGAVPATLAEHFNATDVDLIVMTTHDRGRVERLLLGSAAKSVTRRAHLPVLVVHPSGGESSLDSPVAITRLLAAIDGSPFSEEILPHVATFASLMRAEVTLIGVVQPIVAIASAALDVGPAPTMPLRHDPIESERELPLTPEMERISTEMRKTTGVATSAVVLSDGRPAHAIIHYATQHAIDVIAMTTHSRGALKRAIFGSVSETVLRTGGLPMLLFRP